MGNYYSFSKQDIPKKNDIGLGLIFDKVYKVQKLNS